MHLHLAEVLKKIIWLHKYELLDKEFAMDILKKYVIENNSMKIRRHSKNYFSMLFSTWGCAEKLKIYTQKSLSPIVATVVLKERRQKKKENTEESITFSVGPIS